MKLLKSKSFHHTASVVSKWYLALAIIHQNTVLTLHLFTKTKKFLYSPQYQMLYLILIHFQTFIFVLFCIHAQNYIASWYFPPITVCLNVWLLQLLKTRVSFIHSFSSLVAALSWSELQWRSSQRKAEIYPGWNAGLPVGTKSHSHTLGQFSITNELTYFFSSHFIFKYWNDKILIRVMWISD